MKALTGESIRTEWAAGAESLGETGWSMAWEDGWCDFASPN